jgi:hypothetical protein
MGILRKRMSEVFVVRSKYTQTKRVPHPARGRLAGGMRERMKRFFTSVRFYVRN